VRLIGNIFVINGFRGWLIAVTLIGMALLLVYLLWRLVSLRRNPSTKDPENITPFYDDEDLEGPRLERALGWSLIFVMVSALALPVYFLFEPGREKRMLASFDDRAVERGATLFANPQSTAYDPTKSLLCANCHGVDGGGGTAPYVLQPELDICDDAENKSNPDVPECLPVQAPWVAPPLDTVLLRFDEEQVFNIITYGRPGTPMPAWGVASGKGVLNTQSINDLIAYLKSIQLTSDAAKERSTKALNGYKKLWSNNVDEQKKELATRQAALDKSKASGASVDTIAELQKAVDEQVKVVASATAWSAQVNQMNEGEILFRLNCARCHTRGASYQDPNNIKLPPPKPNGSGAFGPNLTNGSTLIQFPAEAGRQEQINWVTLGVPANELYGERGISSGRMPHFVNQLTKEQIHLIVDYERSL
jgi:mono/diheme cytochrome c family protein